jgi:hypothetical protein
MIGRWLSWLNNSPREKREEDMGAEKRLEDKKESIDRSIEEGRVYSDKLKRTSDKQVAEANVTIATIRGLLALLQDKEEKK